MNKINNQLIRVLMISTSYPANSNDWRGLFIRHLANALANIRNIQIHLWAPPGEIHPEIIPATNTKERIFLTRLMQQGGIAHVLRTGRWKALKIPIELLINIRFSCQRTKIDLYHVNWLQNSLSLPNDGKPIIVSVLGTDMQILKKPLIKPLLRYVFTRHSTIICPNAEWMIKPLQENFGDIAQIKFTPFGIDPMWYEIFRDANQLTTPARWIGVMRITRAKLGPLLEWGEELFCNKFRELHLFGPMQENLKLPEWVHYHGPANPDMLCRNWFPTAQGLITLSRHAEGRPQVMLEAMAAGLPIVASRIPAHENIVFHGETGWLCDTPADVAEGLTYFENVAENHRAGLAARAWTKHEIGTWDDCAARYLTLYQDCLKRVSNE